MRTKIAKQFHWEMSHRLPYQNGLCRNIHGHTYRLELALEGEVAENGMLIDYFNIKEIVSPLIKTFDHSFVCDISDSLMLEFFNRNNLKYTVINCYSTAENLANYFLDELCPKFAIYKNINKITVKICETEDVYAEIERKL